MGLGLLGRGIGDAKYIASCGADLIVTDLKSEGNLAASVAELKDFPNIVYTLGEHKLEDFQNRDLIIKAAGVPLDSPFIAEAQKNGIPVRMSADLFMELSGIPTIGITGTRGKSTVTHMIAAILKEAGEKILLGGNVRGVSNLALLKDVTPEHIAVLELDSWQCQGLGEAKLSPHIAVFTTFYSDHVNYYGSTPSTSLGTSSLTTGKNARDLYLADKANIFLFQHSEDTLVLGSQCAELVKGKYSAQLKSQVVIPGGLPANWQLKIPGEHNRYNAALALAAARAYGVGDEVSREALENFSGVPGRLELVREVNGVKIYNDTAATVPEATLAALEALDVGPTRSNIILIMGGADKGLDMGALIEKVKHLEKVVLLAGTGTDRIKNQLQGNPTIYSSLSDAVAAAYAAATAGDVLLFSPAFASFGMFKNEYDRGDQFNALVGNL